MLVGMRAEVEEGGLEERQDWRRKAGYERQEAETFSCGHFTLSFFAPVWNEEGPCGPRRSSEREIVVWEECETLQ